MSKDFPPPIFYYYMGGKRRKRRVRKERNPRWSSQIWQFAGWIQCSILKEKRVKDANFVEEREGEL
jgi:hypothetical protein